MSHPCSKDTLMNNSANVNNGDEADNHRKTESSHCHVNKRLLPIKLFYLFFFGGVGAVFPYLTVYFKQLGLNPMQIGILGGIRPFIGFVGGIFWGAIADRYRARRLVLLVSLAGWLVLLCAIGFVPSANQAECPLPPYVVQEYLNESRTGTNNTSTVPPISQNDSHSLQDSINSTDRFQSDIIGRMTNPSDTSWLYDSQDLIRVFGVLIALTAFGELMQSPTFSLADTATLDCLQGDYSKYGRQRVWGSFGFGSSSFVVGALIDLTRQDYERCGMGMTFSDYHVAFYVFAGLVVVALVITMKIQFKDHETDVPSEHNLFYLLKVLCDVSHISVLLVALFMGITAGLVISFLFWHLENIGASQLLMGTASLVSVTSEICVFFISHHLIRIFGHIGLLYIGLTTHIIRLFAFGYLTNPWFVLPAEMLQGLAFAGSWSAMMSYIALAVPCDSFATAQGILNGAYWGLGLGIGSLTGGLFVNSFGAVLTFYGLAIGNAIVLASFFVVQQLAPKPKFLNADNLERNGLLDPLGEKHNSAIHSK